MCHCCIYSLFLLTPVLITDVLLCVLMNTTQGLPYHFEKLLFGLTILVYFSEKETCLAFQFHRWKRLSVWNTGYRIKWGARFKAGLCSKQKSQRQYKNSYPLCHLLLEKRLNYSKDPFENPRLINYVNGLDSDRKPILWIRRENSHSWALSNDSHMLCVLM